MLSPFSEDFIKEKLESLEKKLEESLASYKHLDRDSASEVTEKSQPKEDSYTKNKLEELEKRLDDSLSTTRKTKTKIVEEQAQQAENKRLIEELKQV